MCRDTSCSRYVFRQIGYGRTGKGLKDAGKNRLLVERSYELEELGHIVVKTWASVCGGGKCPDESVVSNKDVEAM